MDFRVAPQAESDLDEIWYFLATQSSNIDVADRVIDSIAARFALLARQPYIGRRRDNDLRPGVRSFVVGAYVIAYRVDDDYVLILRVLFDVQYLADKRIHIDQLAAAFLERSRAFDVYSLALLSKPQFWRDEEEIRFVSKRQNVSVVIEDSRATRLFIGDSLSAGVTDRIISVAGAIEVLPADGGLWPHIPNWSRHAGCPCHHVAAARGSFGAFGR